MEITKELRAHLIEKFSLAADASDEAAKSLVATKMMSGELTLETIKGLSVNGGEARVRAIVSEEMTKHFDALGTKMIDAIHGQKQPAEGEGNGAAAEGAKPETDKAAHGLNKPETPATDATSQSPSDDASKAFMAGAGGDGASETVSVRLKSVVERFDDTRTALTYQKSSDPVLRRTMGNRQLYTGAPDPGVDGGVAGRALNEPTERTKAIAGAWMKRLCNKAFTSSGAAVPFEYRMNEQDRQLCEYAVHECKWVGPLQHRSIDSDEATAWFRGEKVASEIWRKALLDDSTSGGLEAVPIEFDDVAIITPLLTGQLLPLANIINVTRRRIEGFSVSNPTMQWGDPEGTEISLFNTDSFISAFDNTVYPLTGSVEHGLDFAADSPVAVADIMVQRYGEVHRQELDKVIALGSGSDRPEGVMNSGASSSTISNTTTGPPTVSDYEGMIFGVDRAFREEAGERFVLVMNDTTYSRARGIEVVASSDQRRVFGVADQQSYRFLDTNVRIIPGLTNSQSFAVCMNRYRLYRRQGFEVKTTTEGKELMRANKRLIIVRSRWGGALDHASAAVVNSNLQS